MSFEFLTLPNVIQLVLFFAVVLLLAKPLGVYMAKIYSGERTFMTPVLGWLENGIYKISGIQRDREMNWKEYAAAVLVFSLVGFVVLFLLLRFQSVFGHNPEHFGNLSTGLAFNTAVSFITNTNWQAYSGETTLSYFSQMAGLTVQNFLSAAAGMGVLAVLIRGFVRKNTPSLGNFWVDLVRGCLYILLPLALIIAIVLASQGVVQNLGSYVSYQPLEGKESVIATGPVAAQEAIKMLGTNGGGFFNANSAHPFENPTPLTNFIEVVLILLIPAALCFTFGRMINDNRQGRALLIAKVIVFIPFLVLAIGAEQKGNPKFKALGIDQHVSLTQSGGNMEGKETRFGIVNSALWATATTAASNGATNAMHDSFTPIGGAVPLIMMQFGEVIFGGVGSGLYGMLVFVILTVFIAGLMVGRTPEFLGKKIQAFEIKMASIAILVPPFFVLIGTSIAVLTEAGRAGMSNQGIHGFSEILYGFTSAANNNGSAFAGLNANTPFYNYILGFVMLFGRFFVMLPVLAIAGSLASKNSVPVSAGTLPTQGVIFITILIAVIAMVGVLTFVPSLALGPIAENFYLK